ncbi:hypothetical protein GGF37_002430, partial [Kickxella alabastrina]
MSQQHLAPAGVNEKSIIEPAEDFFMHQVIVLGTRSPRSPVREDEAKSSGNLLASQILPGAACKATEQQQAKATFPEENTEDISRMLFLAGSSAAVAQSPIIRYTAEELLALRESSLIRLPLDFSPYTPLRPGSQVKLPEITQATIDAKLSLGNPYIGLEHIPRTQKDIVLAPQRSANLAHRGQNASQRVFGVPRNNGVNSNQAVAMFDGGVVPEGRNAGGGYASKGSSTSSIGTRGSAGRSGNNAAGGGQSTNRQHNGHDNSRSGVVSWRASGPTRTPGGSISMAPAAAPAAATLSNNHGHLGEIAEGGKPEWMDDDLVYDENKSARQMHDMEEWKRRMKEGGGTNGSALQLGGNNPNAIDMSSGLAADQIDQSSAGGDKGAVRGSRFLRLFSANEQQADHAAADLSGSTLPVPGGLLHDVMAASAYANGLAYPNDSLQQPQQQSGDQLSKLFKVFGNKVSLGGNANANVPVPGPAAAASANGWAAHESQNAALAMHNAQALNSMHAVESMRMAMLMQAAANDTSVMGQHIEAVAQQSAAISAAPAPLGLAPMSSAGATQSLSPPVAAATSVAGQRVRTSSPAPINEALRGIVPTSVFRKSVQGGGHSAGYKRPESMPASRAATPARSLPSWLVELSRGGASPASDPANGAALAANESLLGVHDAAGSLEREFPALGIKAQQADNRSVSSLSVQPSVGAPSEANSEAAQNPEVQPMAMHQMAVGGIAMPAPEPMQQMHHAMPPPQGMMGMLPPHMMMPGMVHPSSMGGQMPPMGGQMPPMGGQMPPMGGQMPPMGMLQPHHPMAFHPNM